MKIERLGSILSQETIRKLSHDDRGTIMSNVPMEIETNRPILEAASGHVLINGLGLGMVPSALLSNPLVKKITVVELDKYVIALTSPDV